MSQTHFALYGNVKILRSYCEECRTFAFVIGGKLQCCGKPCVDEPTHYRRMSAPDYKRKLPPAADQRTILNAQDHKCFYCEQSFGKLVFVRRHRTRGNGPSQQGPNSGNRTKVQRVLRVVWDHMVPYAWSAQNDSANFVAACQYCNAWKHSTIFATVEEAQLFVYQRWQEEKESPEAEVLDVSEGV